MARENISRKAVSQVLRDYAKQYRLHPWFTAGGILLPGIGSIFVFFIPPLIIGRIVNMISVGSDISFSKVGVLIALFGGLWLIGEGCWRAGMYFLTKLEATAMRNLSKSSFDRLIERDYDFYASNFVGSLTKRAIAYVKNFEGFTDTFSFNVTPNILPMIFALVILAQYSVWISILLLLALVFVILVTVPLIKRRAGLVVERHNASSALTGRLSDTISNILAVKSFAREEDEAREYDAHMLRFSNAFSAAAYFHIFRIDLALSPLYVLTNLAGLLVGIYFTTVHKLQPGALVVIFSYFGKVTQSFWQINTVYRNMENTITEAAEFTELTINPPAVQDVRGATALQATNGAIEFNSVDFSYLEDGAPFFADFNLVIPAGQRVGLVGPSGGGKTTITKLLMRFLNILRGEIMIDGQDIFHMKQSSVRNVISYVPQEPLLLHRSLLENIAYGNPDAKMQEVIEAAKSAHAHEFIETLPHGYDTLVGERGVKLSGGQRQRVAIARAMLKNAPILVLDEATSALDSESEKYIQESLWKLMENKTALVIAHRLSTIKHLDRIIVLDNGKIVQDGTHDALIQDVDGLYARLWSHQSGGFIEE